MFELSLKYFEKNSNLADRYVEIARRISMKTRIRIPNIYKRYYICRKCKRLIVPGYTCRIRIRSKGNPRIIITCLRCGAIKRIPIRHRHNR
ncbi:MAG: ribonuclease P [Candidatus Bathyarchaeota archaeon]|nr:ribonuclease P [Candidatus Bathyarchaeota archaeon]